MAWGRRVPDLPPVLPGHDRVRSGRSGRRHGAAGPPGLAGRRRALAVADPPEPRRGRRLRRRRPPRRRRVLRRPARARPPAGRRARARAARAAGLGAQPHQRRPPVVRLVPPRPGRPARRLVLVGRRAGEQLAQRVRRSGVDVRRGARPVLPAPVHPGPARPELEPAGRARGDARRPALLARPRRGRVPRGRGQPDRPRPRPARPPARRPGRPRTSSSAATATRARTTCCGRSARCWTATRATG